MTRFSSWITAGAATPELPRSLLTSAGHSCTSSFPAHSQRGSRSVLRVHPTPTAGRLEKLVFDFLINSEVIVTDVAEGERVLTETLGFGLQKDTWKSLMPGKGFTYLFARVHPSLKISPTRIELMAAAPSDPQADPTTTISFLPQLLETQGDRPWKTHANELATSDIQAVATRLERNGCPFFTMPATEQYPFSRLWLGWTESDPGAYEPEVDGGLMLEICETQALMSGPPWELPDVPDLPPGSMVRVLQRSWIVPDLDKSLTALEQNLAMVPSEGPTLDIVSNCRRAAFSFDHPRSADLELLEPIGPGDVMEALDSWGPGSWVIRIGVNDLESKAVDLRARGTSFVLKPGPADKPVLRVGTGSVDFADIFEFAEVD